MLTCFQELFLLSSTRMSAPWEQGLYLVKPGQSRSVACLINEQVHSGHYMTHTQTLSQLILIPAPGPHTISPDYAEEERSTWLFPNPIEQT